jgi:hypothetical protein
LRVVQGESSRSTTARGAFHNYLFHIPAAGKRFNHGDMCRNCLCTMAAGTILHLIDRAPDAVPSWSRGWPDADADTTGRRPIDALPTATN